MKPLHVIASSESSLHPGAPFSGLVVIYMQVEVAGRHV